MSSSPVGARKTARPRRRRHALRGPTPLRRCSHLGGASRSPGRPRLRPPTPHRPRPPSPHRPIRRRLTRRRPVRHQRRNRRLPGRLRPPLQGRSPPPRRPEARSRRPPSRARRRHRRPRRVPRRPAGAVAPKQLLLAKRPHRRRSQAHPLPRHQLRTQRRLLQSRNRVHGRLPPLLRFPTRQGATAMPEQQCRGLLHSPIRLTQTTTYRLTSSQPSVLMRRRLNPQRRPRRLRRPRMMSGRLIPACTRLLVAAATTPGLMRKHRQQTRAVTTM